MRIIKSAAGIFICYLIDILRGGSGFVFYSLIAVLWCIRDYVSETKQFALQRVIGTIVGAIYGLAYIMLIRTFPIDFAYPIDNVLQGLFVSVAVVVILYTTVLTKQKQASYFSCVVFLSIVVNHVEDINPYLFVWNRFLDTVIGIIVAVFLNCLSFGNNNNDNILFLSGLDDTLLAPGGEVSAFSRVELNRMIEKGVNFTVSTIRTPASLLEPLRGINLSLPVIAMDGAALYNVADNSYEKVYIMPEEHCAEVRNYFNSMNLSYFTNVVIEDVLLIYYMNSENTYYNQLIDKMRKSPYRNYIKHDEPIIRNVIYYMVIDEKSEIERLYSKLCGEVIFSELKITVNDSVNMPGCSILRVFDKNASKENMIDYLKKKLKIDKTVTFGSIEGKYTHIIKPGDFNGVVKIMRKSLKNKKSV